MEGPNPAGDASAWRPDAPRSLIVAPAEGLDLDLAPNEEHTRSGRLSGEGRSGQGPGPPRRGWNEDQAPEARIRRPDPVERKT